MKVNGESIYATQSAAFAQAPAWGRITRKPAGDGRSERLYLHVFDWPADGVLRLPPTGKVDEAVLLAEPGTALRAETVGGELRLQLPPKAPDADASVIRLTLAQEP